MPKNSTLPDVESTTQSSATAHPILSGNPYAANIASTQLQFAHPIPNLPVLNELAIKAEAYLADTDLIPEETAIIGAQHILETTATLLGKFRELGFEVYITGKCYSTNPAVLKSMENLGIHVWAGSQPEKLGEYQAACEKDIMIVLNAVEQNRKIKNIIILDDGGRFYEKIPAHFYMNYLVGGVEQTRAGYYSHTLLNVPPIPIVNTAQCGAKVLFESPFIADAAVEQIVTITNQLKDKRRYVMGIVGFGYIGRALADRLLQEGFSVCIFDKDENSYQNYKNINRVKIMYSVERLFTYTNFIIGCTGQDCTTTFDPMSLNGNDRVVLSLTSEDKELRGLLQTIAKESGRAAFDPLSTVRCYTNHGNKIEILYGGFPINFASSAVKPFNVPAPRIALTQALLFGAVMQAIGLMLKSKGTNKDFSSASVMLDPDLQQYITNNWYTTTIKEDSLPHELIKKFISDKTFVIANSKGSYNEADSICKSGIMGTQPKKIMAKL